LGCGTGNHYFFLVEKDYQVTGIDLSEKNIDLANKKLLNSTINESQLQFIRFLLFFM